MTTRINGERLLGDLQTLRGFGTCGNGVVRQSLSDVDMESRRWLAGRMEDAGLAATIDGIGTVLGRSRRAGRALLVGSHTDTQPTGGWLDGTLGVIYGLEVVRALAEERVTRELAVDVASWIDEEGTFFGLLGSKSFCGLIETDDLDGATDAEGKALRDALRDAGLEGRPLLRCEEGRYRGYVEAHIEQGPWLEEERKRIGVVTGIVGIHDMVIRFDGQQNHAGTTPMSRRRDAGAALVAFASRIHEAFAANAGPRSVWTIGDIRLDPGAASIIPGHAWLSLQYRDADEGRMDRFGEVVGDLVRECNESGPVEVSMEPTRDRTVSALMNADLQRSLEQAAERHAPGNWMSMPSAAVHDAQNLARVMPSAMMFIPSKGGISHAFEEDTSEDDIVLGCQVFADAIASILLDAG